MRVRQFAFEEGERVVRILKTNFFSRSVCVRV